VQFHVASARCGSQFAALAFALLPSPDLAAWRRASYWKGTALGACAAIVGFAAIIPIWETFAPHRQLQLATARRWLVNVTLWIAGALCWRALGGTGAVAAARGRID
jgi:hypothetical protein